MHIVKKDWFNFCCLRVMSFGF